MYHRYLNAQRWKATGQKGRDFAASGGKLQGPWGGFSSLAIFAVTTAPCGSEPVGAKLARDDIVTYNICAGFKNAIASKLCSHRLTPPTGSPTGMGVP
jgi:hypothetical protein